MRQFENCIEDCDDVIKLIEKVSEKEKEEDPFFFKVLTRAHIKKGAALGFLSKFDEAVADFEKAIALRTLTEEEFAIVVADIERIKT